MIIRFSPSTRTEIREEDTWQLTHGVEIETYTGLQVQNRLFKSWVRLQVKGFDPITVYVQTTYQKDPENIAPGIARAMIQKIEEKLKFQNWDTEIDLFSLIPQL